LSDVCPESLPYFSAAPCLLLFAPLR
jgi:hypothetical protein